MDDNDAIIEQIKQLQVGTIIPNPQASPRSGSQSGSKHAGVTIEGWGKRKGQNALYYSLPHCLTGKTPYQKTVTVAEFEQVLNVLRHGSPFTRKWFYENMPGGHRQGDTSFTTIGGVLVFLGVASEQQPGVYQLQNGEQGDDQRTATGERHPTA